jgi:hypothetical protein
MTSLLMPADELIKRGGVAISGFGPSRHFLRLHKDGRRWGEPDIDEDL